MGPYAAGKWALEAIAETLAIEAAHFGISVQLLEPGAVSSGGAERAKVFLDDGNPYRPLLDQMQGFRSDPITVQEVAGAVASALKDIHPPLRIPVGAPATSLLAARKAAPEDVPFLAARLTGDQARIQPADAIAIGAGPKRWLTGNQAAADPGRRPAGPARARRCRARQ